MPELAEKRIAGSIGLLQRVYQVIFITEKLNTCLVKYLSSERSIDHEHMSQSEQRYEHILIKDKKTMMTMLQGKITYFGLNCIK